MSGPGHHTTQRYHLAQFVGDSPKGHVWVYDKTAGTTRSDVPENISVENHFYSIENEDGSWDTRLDDWITGVEGKAKPVYDALLKEQVPPYSQDKYDFALYLAVSHARTRTQRRIATETYGNFMQTMMYAMASNDQWFAREVKAYEEKHGKSVTDDEKQRLREATLNPAGNIQVSVSKNMAFEVWGFIDKLAPIFLNMNWTIMRPRHGYFITGDNPLARRSFGKRVPGRGDGGFLNKNVEVSFPISPKSMLLLEHKTRRSPVYSVSRTVVDGLNEVRAANCERELYSHVNDSRITRLAGRFRNARPRMTLTGLGPQEFAKVVTPRRFNKG